MRCSCSSWCSCTEHPRLAMKNTPPTPNTRLSLPRTGRRPGPSSVSLAGQDFDFVDAAELSFLEPECDHIPVVPEIDPPPWGGLIIRFPCGSEDGNITHPR